MIGMCLLLPACISMRVQFRRNGNKMLTGSILYELFRYGGWVLGINFCAMVLTNYFLGVKGISEEAFYSFQFAIKYLVISVPLAFFAPYVLEVCKKYFSITFTVGGNDEKDK